MLKNIELLYNPNEKYITYGFIKQHFKLSSDHTSYFINNFFTKIRLPKYSFQEQVILFSEFKEFCLSDEYFEVLNMFYNRKLKSKISNQNSRIKSFNQTGVINLNQIKQLLLFQQNKCFYCNIEIQPYIPSKWAIEHYIPLSKGGTNNIENIRISCHCCNHSKCGLMPEEFINTRLRKHF